MAKRYLPQAASETSVDLPTPPDGKLTKANKESITKTYQDLVEQRGYEVKQNVASRQMSEITKTGAHNHADVVEELEEIREQPRGKWSQRHVDAYTEDAAQLSRKQQLGLVDGVGFKITEASERSVSPDPKKASWIERKLGGES